MRSSLVLGTIGFLGLVLGVVGCGGGSPRINAGGASFPEPIIQKWVGEYRPAEPVDISYIKSGSGKGIKDLTAGLVDFGCTDAPMDREELAAAEAASGPVLHVPVIMGAVAIVYNVPGVADLKLSGPVLADIYTGKIDKWNDARIKELNPGANLPGDKIIPVQRAESSGTTNIFSDYLSKVSSAFAKDVGASKQMNALKDVSGQKGNDGIAAFVKGNPGAIGYVEMAYAETGGLSSAALENKAGKFVKPSASAVSAAADAAMKEEKPGEPYTLHDLTYSLTNAGGDASYPIVGMSYAILFETMPADKGPGVVAFLKWAVTDGQQFAEEMHYAPLPEALQTRAIEKLDGVTFK